MLKKLCIFAALSIAVLISSAMVTTKTEAAVRDKDAVRAIIGEASGEGYRGMLAVACGIRNRGSLKGVYGLHAAHVNKESAWVWKLAQKAWKASANNDIVGGAQFWETTDRPRPSWSKRMLITVKIGKHVFYYDPPHEGMQYDMRLVMNSKGKAGWILDYYDERGNRWREADGDLYNEKGERLYSEKG